MYIKIVRDDNKTFRLGGSYKDDAAWGITEVNGLGMAENEIETATPASGDGSTVISERIPHRNIDIAASVKNKKQNATERKNAISFFNPKHSFILYVTHNNNSRWIVAKIEKFQMETRSADEHSALNLALTCPDPYFNSVDNFGKNIAAITGAIGFPYISSVETGFRTGVYNFAKQVLIENTGDVDTYATIQIKATGDVTNPKIIENGVYIRLIDTLTEGDVVEIDMVENTITKNGENCIGKVDRTSSFTDMVLKSGDNEVSFDADEGDSNMKVVLYYNLRYMGI
jgi:phage-related protein